MAKIALGDHLHPVIRAFITAVIFPGIALAFYFGNESVSAMYTAGQIESGMLSLFVLAAFVLNAVALVWLWLRSINPTKEDMVAEFAGAFIILIPILVVNGFSLVPDSGIRLMVEVLSMAYLLAAVVALSDVNKVKVQAQSSKKSKKKSKK